MKGPGDAGCDPVKRPHSSCYAFPCLNLKLFVLNFSHVAFIQQVFIEPLDCTCHQYNQEETINTWPQVAVSLGTWRQVIKITVQLYVASCVDVFLKLP